MEYTLPSLYELSATNRMLQHTQTHTKLGIVLGSKAQHVMLPPCHPLANPASPRRTRVHQLGATYTENSAGPERTTAI